jgi:predicted acetyltransferase
MNLPQRMTQPVGEGDLAAYARALSLAFGGRPPTESLAYLKTLDLREVRLLRPGPGGPIDGEALGGLVRIPMGQFFGGRSVPMVGVAGVAVPPEHKGRGAASSLMSAFLHEEHARGTALSTLYGASQELYRRVGYERAGTRMEFRAPLARLPRMRTAVGVRVREAGEGDRVAIHAAYRELAAAHDGWLDRGDYVWGRVERPPQTHTHAFVVEATAGGGGEGGVEGWLTLTQPAATVGDTSRRYEVHTLDFCARTSRAGRALWSLLAGFSTVGTEAVWWGGAAHPMLGLLPEACYRAVLRDHWMTRIVTLPGAVAARGYPHGLAVELHLDVVDPVIEDNAGCWVIEVGGEIGAAHRGGRGELRVGIGALAAMYTGFMPASQLAMLGLVEGPQHAVRIADSVFAPTGGPPSMMEMF